MAKEYEQRWFEYQTRARKLFSTQQLVSAFTALLPIYSERIGRHLRRNADARILDCPCGSGKVSYYLRCNGFEQVDSIDIDENSIVLARSIGLNAKTADAFQWLGTKREGYDAIVSLDFLEHLDKSAALQFLDLCLVALKPGGLLILRTPCGEGPFFGTAAFNDITHEWVPTSGVLRNLLEMAGYCDVEITPDAPVPYKPANWMRLVIFRAACGIGSFVGQVAGIGSPAIWTPNMWAVARAPEEKARDG